MVKPAYHWETKDPFFARDHDRVGGIPGVLGPWQLLLLRRHGLRPHHRLLDLGCGTLRGGLWLMQYLQPGRYTGLDPNPDLLEIGRSLVSAAGLRGQEPTLGGLDLLDSISGEHFNFALTQSVLNHLDEPGIAHTIARIARVLDRGGVWITTGLFRRQRFGVMVGRPHPDRAREYLGTTIDHSWWEVALAQHGLSASQDRGARHPRGQDVMIVRADR